MGNDSNNSHYEYIVGIEFGSAGISYAYQITSNIYRANPILSNFKGQGDNKVPNEIILGDKLENVLAFGNECSTYISNNKKTQDSYLHFKDIKMNLYNKNYFIK